MCASVRLMNIWMIFKDIKAMSATNSKHCTELSMHFLDPELLKKRNILIGNSSKLHVEANIYRETLDNVL